jgi:aminoglycoside phosphotransferase (APT) family kinase protein
VQRRLVAAAYAGAHHLDSVDHTCLVHGAFETRNLLVDPDSGAVTGLLDWSTAHAGSPVTDLGAVIRGLDGTPFADAVVSTFERAAPTLPPSLREAAAGADLVAMVELATRDTDHEVVREARARLWEIGADPLD